jgi:hypothetical protein
MKKRKRCVGSSETVKSQGSGEVVEKRYKKRVISRGGDKLIRPGRNECAAISPQRKLLGNSAGWIKTFV